jgi:hypothetical protein
MKCSEELISWSIPYATSKFEVPEAAIFEGECDICGCKTAKEKWPIYACADMEECDWCMCTECYSKEAFKYISTDPDVKGQDEDPGVPLGVPARSITLHQRSECLHLTTTTRDARILFRIEAVDSLLGSLAASQSSIFASKLQRLEHEYRQQLQTEQETAEYVQAIDASDEAVGEVNGCRYQYIRRHFASAFDTNGTLYYIATNGGKTTYTNPHESGAVTAKMSGMAERDRTGKAGM